MARLDARREQRDLRDAPEGGEQRDRDAQGQTETVFPELAQAHSELHLRIQRVYAPETSAATRHGRTAPSPPLMWRWRRLRSTEHTRSSHGRWRPRPSIAAPATMTPPTCCTRRCSTPTPATARPRRAWPRAWGGRRCAACVTRAVGARGMLEAGVSAPARVEVPAAVELPARQRHADRPAARPVPRLGSHCARQGRPVRLEALAARSTGYCHVEAAGEHALIEIGDRTEINNNSMLKSEGVGLRIGAQGLFGAHIEIFDSTFTTCTRSAGIPARRGWHRSRSRTTSSWA